MSTHRFKKRFGQNFLQDQNIIAKILAAAGLQPGQQVLEIGPGLGALTNPLLAAGVELTVMEVDRDLIAQLEARSEPQLRVAAGDALQLDWPQLLPEPPYTLVANLPYNISSQILFKILDHREHFGRLVLMFQKEVGERLLAAPGTRDYGILSVLVQTWFDLQRVVRVAPGCFYPPPKIDSVVLRFDLLAEPRVFVADEALYRRLVRGAFAQRRKTLRNSLIGSGWPDAVIDELLARCAIDPQRRGETLSIEEFGRMCEVLAALPPTMQGDS